MNKRKGLLPRLAVTGIRKNGATYLPYIGVCIFAVFTYFVFDLILHNDIVKTIPRASYATMLMYIGFILLGIIMVPFLYYTNSFLIKRRKKELGLYSILGMEKKHIAMLLFLETILIYLIVCAGAIGLGLLFSRLLFLLLLNLAGLPVQAEFSISPAAVGDTVLFFALVSLINLTANLYQVGRVSPAELMSESGKGEKQARCIWLWSILGVMSMGGGYYLAIKAELDSMIFMNFFLAVFLVIAGTYFLFTSGSIFCLRILKKRKSFYYGPENMITISGMLYRMKKNAASLVNICIFATMVIITVTCTVSLYLGIPAIQAFQYPFRLRISFQSARLSDREGLREEIFSLAKQNGAELSDYQEYEYVSCSVVREGDSFIVNDGSYNYQDWYVLNLMTLAEYNRLEGTDYVLEEGEALVYSTGADFGCDKVGLGDVSYQVKEELRKSRLAPKAGDNSFGEAYTVILKGEEEVKNAALYYGVDSMAEGTYRIEMNPVGEDGQTESFCAQLGQLAAAKAGFAEFRDYEENIKNMQSMYGGLLFIGIFFGLIFMICLLIIMYYKQITEGFEDQRAFDIMQKVGMGDREVKRTIKRQVLMVFFLPLLGAILHTAVGTNMIIKLMGALELFKPELIIGCAAAACVVFAAVYFFCYKRTAAAYYRIVRKMNA